MASPPALIPVGVIASAHGVRGWVKIRPLIDPSEDLFAAGTLFDASGARQFRLSAQGRKDAVWIVAIEGVTDRNAAELLKNTQLYAPSSALPEKPSNQWYYSELIGLEARLSDGKAYGKITALHNFGAGDIVDIALPDGKSEMLPFTSAFIGDIHTDQGYLIVFPPDYVEAKE